jgi:hypothetical protein
MKHLPSGAGFGSSGAREDSVAASREDAAPDVTTPRNAADDSGSHTGHEASRMYLKIC